MSFRFFTNTISQASRHVAAWIFIVGLVLIGFAFLIWVLRELFAMLFAAVFCVVGIGCITTAVKIFWGTRKAEKKEGDCRQGYRKNVRIHTEDYHET